MQNLFHHISNDTTFFCLAFLFSLSLLYWAKNSSVLLSLLIIGIVIMLLVYFEEIYQAYFGILNDIKYSVLHIYVVAVHLSILSTLHKYQMLLFITYFMVISMAQTLVGIFITLVISLVILTFSQAPLSEIVLISLFLLVLMLMKLSNNKDKIYQWQINTTIRRFFSLLYSRHYLWKSNLISQEAERNYWNLIQRCCVNNKDYVTPGSSFIVIDTTRHNKEKLSYKDALHNLHKLLKHQLAIANIVLRYKSQPNTVYSDLSKPIFYQILFSIACNVLALSDQNSTINVSIHNSKSEEQITFTYQGYSLNKEHLVHLIKKKHINSFILNWEEVFRSLDLHGFEVDIIKQRGCNQIILLRHIKFKNNIVKLHSYN